MAGIDYTKYPEGWEAVKKMITTTDDPKALESFMLDFAKNVVSQ